MTRFVIIDALTRPDTLNAILFYAEALPHRSLFDGQPEATLAHAGPWLVQLSDHGPGNIEAWLSALERNEGAVTWLTSEATFTVLFQHLQTHLDITLPDGSLALLRFWDGRTFHRLEWVLTLEQLLELMGPVTSWRANAGRFQVNLQRSEIEHLIEERRP
ncbi:DUF4123 domain-containing protein [Pseudomonas agarici]|uniref:DUF4123 domain-containing protein n=1 Tax=Pseudomonas agarici TaxID=46677 RepID=UPI0002FC4FCE|nr:DUF4123 domain-containing protein [Pseudomonas agarici]NWC10766.1 DUF4123 domain-containing protein [Pseudomonas agarici]SEL49006.1 protein of unknown function [Pseudomonas agarici]